MQRSIHIPSWQRRPRASFRVLLASVVAAVILMSTLPLSAAAVGVLWTDQFGTADSDIPFAIAADGGGLTVAGYTYGSLEGTRAGLTDAFLRRYDTAGSPLWTDQFGTSSSDFAQAIAADAGGLTVAGNTFGSLEGTNAGSYDAFLRRYDASGTLLWTDQFGTSSSDSAQAIAADAGGLTVAGYTFGSLEGTNAGSYDAFLRRYDASGTVLWTDQFGTAADDFAQAIAADAGGLTVAGYTGGSLEGTSAGGGGDAFLRRYDTSGTLLWTRQFGTSGFDSAQAIAVDAGGLTVAGYTGGSLEGANAGLTDAFLRRYDASGNLLWTRQFGTPTEDLGLGIAADAGGLTVAGYTGGALEGTNAGSYDAFLRRYDHLPPSGSVTIDGGVTYTRSTTVSVAVPATDVNGTAVSKVRLSNSPLMSDLDPRLLAAGETRDYGTPQSWNLADPDTGGSTTNGTRYVYVQWLDGADNWSAVRSDTIILDTVRPTSTPPAEVFVRGTRLGTTVVPVRLSWSGSDATSGIARYQLQQYSGGSWNNVSLPTPTTRIVDRSLAPGSSYRFRDRAIDRAGNIGNWATAPGFALQAVQENASAVKYIGSWPRVSWSAAYGGYLRYASSAGTEAELTFSGRDVAFVSTTGPNRGRAAVYLDGVKVATLDLYSATTRSRVIVFTKSWAAKGTHKVEIRPLGTRNAASSGTRVDFDAIILVAG